MMHQFRKVVLAGVGAAALGFSSVAGAGVIPLDTFITGSGFGSTPPTGTVTITDIGTDVRVDFEISDGDLSALFFNLVDDFDFDDLSLSAVSTMPGSPGVSLLDSPRAPSNLNFDFGVDFGRGMGSGVVTSGSFVLKIEGLDLSQPSFYQTSTNAGGSATVTVGARIQSLGPNDGGSATIGGNPGGSSGGGSSGGTPVPAPAALGLFALAAAGLMSRRRRPQ